MTHPVIGAIESGVLKMFGDNGSIVTLAFLISETEMRSFSMIDLKQFGPVRSVLVSMAKDMSATHYVLVSEIHLVKEGVKTEGLILFWESKEQQGLVVYEIDHSESKAKLTHRQEPKLLIDGLLTGVLFKSTMH